MWPGPGSGNRPFPPERISLRCAGGLSSGSLGQEHSPLLRDRVLLGWQHTTCIGGSFPPHTSPLASPLCWALLPESHKLQFSQEASRPRFPCSDSMPHALLLLSLLGSLCLLSGATTLGRVHPTGIPGRGSVPPLGVETGEEGLRFARQHFHGWMMFVATWCHVCFSESHVPCPGFILGSSRLRPCVCTRLGRNLPHPPSPRSAGMLCGDAVCHRVMLRPFILAARRQQGVT